MTQIILSYSNYNIGHTWVSDRSREQIVDIVFDYFAIENTKIKFNYLGQSYQGEVVDYVYYGDENKIKLVLEYVR